MKRPATKYVTVDGAEVAYQVLGTGPPDLIWVTGLGHIDMRWESPVFAEYLNNLASMSRLILFDRRGTGASEAVPNDAFPTWEDWSDDVRVVLDAAESAQAVVFGEVDGGGMAMFFAATHPQRVSALILAKLKRYGGTEIDTAGDGFFVTFDGPARAVRCACAIRDSVDALGLRIRAGVHTGEVERSDEELRGLAIHIGARVGAAAGAGEVLVSRTVADLVAGSGLTLSDRGEHDLKGVPGPWRLFAVEG
jgi:pimeloyl-ACP methyl ester carboxylesterase